MDDRNAQVGWTEAQWNRVREEVLRAWQSVRVAGSFLPVYGQLPPSTQVVPSEMLNPNGTVDERSTAPLLEISLPVVLTRQQTLEEDLSSALLQFRRRATQVAQLEDWYIFNGTHPSFELLQRLVLTRDEFTDLKLTHWDAGILGLVDLLGFAPDELAVLYQSAAQAETLPWAPSSSFFKDLPTRDWAVISGVSGSFADSYTQTQGLRRRNPGALGLVEGAEADGARAADPAYQLDNEGLIKAIVDAMQLLEHRGYVAPYVCVFGRGPFEAAHRPIKDSSLVLPRDRLEPLLGRDLLHASAMNVVPQSLRRRNTVWQNRGVLLSSAGDAVDLAIATDATPEFRYVDARGRYVFSVFERFALRIKDPKAIVSLTFRTSGKSARPADILVVPPPSDAPPPPEDVEGVPPEDVERVSPEDAPPPPEDVGHAPPSGKSVGFMANLWLLVLGLVRDGRRHGSGDHPEN